MHKKPHTHHFPEFKEQALLKALHRGTRSTLSIASELNMSACTLKRWVRDSGKVAEQAHAQTSVALDGPAASWSPSQRLTALQESYCLSGSALAGGCRERGLFEHQLTAAARRLLHPDRARLARDAQRLSRAAAPARSVAA